MELRPLPSDVIQKFRALAQQVVEEASKEDELSQRIYSSYMEFLNDVKGYHAISEQAYLNAR